MEGAPARDRRVRRTRALLENGLLSLLAEKGLEHIAMREVCRRADVATATPYAHYRDVVDILEQMEERLWRAMQAALAHAPREQGITRALLLEVTGLVEQERGLCRALLCHGADPAFSGRLQALLEADMAARLHRPDAAFRAAFLLGGCLAVIERWLKAERPESPAEMAELLLNLMA